MHQILVADNIRLAMNGAQCTAQRDGRDMIA